MARLKKIEEPVVVEATLTPTEFEIHDSSQELLAKVAMFDSESAVVEIKTVVNSNKETTLNSKVTDVNAFIYFRSSLFIISRSPKS